MWAKHRPDLDRVVLTPTRVSGLFTPRHPSHNRLLLGCPSHLRVSCPVDPRRRSVHATRPFSHPSPNVFSVFIARLPTEPPACILPRTQWVCIVSAIDRTPAFVRVLCGGQRLPARYPCHNQVHLAILGGYLPRPGSAERTDLADLSLRPCPFFGLRPDVCPSPSTRRARVLHPHSRTARMTSAPNHPLLSLLTTWLVMPRLPQPPRPDQAPRPSKTRESYQTSSASCPLPVRCIAPTSQHSLNGRSRPFRDRTAPGGS